MSRTIRIDERTDSDASMNNERRRDIDGHRDTAEAPPRDVLGPGALVLRGFAVDVAGQLKDAVRGVARSSPFRNMITPGGFTMSVAMTNCGDLGWVSDRSGYRYDPLDPDTGAAWPRMPDVMLELARRAAASAGFDAFDPNVCLINRYRTGSRLSLHQDRDEQDFRAPIVSVSLGVPATFLFGGLRRKDPAARVPVMHGDVVVWGGPDRMRYHGVLAVKAASHSFAGPERVNLTFRKALPTGTRA